MDKEDIQELMGQLSRINLVIQEQDDKYQPKISSLQRDIYNARQRMNKGLKFRILTVVSSLMIFMWGIGIILLFILLKNQNQREMEVNQEIAEYEREIQRLNQDRQQGIATRLNEMGLRNIIPDAYVSRGNVVALYNYFKNGRADSLKEALNLLEAEVHQRRVEDLTAQSIDAANAAYYEAAEANRRIR
ncbi:hypothetical protein [Weissella confusa]